MKKFAYIQHHGLPSQKAHSVYIVKSAEAAANIYSSSYLVVPDFNESSNLNIRRYYQLKNLKIKINQLKAFNLRNYWFIPKWIKNHTWFLFSSWIFAIKSLAWAKKNKIEIIQTGDRELIFLLKIFKKIYSPNIIYDVHYDFSVNKYDGLMERLIISRVNLFAVNCLFLKKKFINLGISSDKVIALSHGYDPKKFNKLTKKQSRKKYNFPKDKFIVGYIGKFETLGIQKGISELLVAAKKLKQKMPICIVAIGGPGHLVKEYQDLATELKLDKDEAIIKDYVSHSEVADIIVGFDVASLLYPPTGYFVEKMSPMKAVEYQASKKPIIATNIPSISQVLEDQAYYPKSYTVSSIASTLEKMYKNKVYLKSYKYKNILTWLDRQKEIFKYL